MNCRPLSTPNSSRCRWPWRFQPKIDASLGFGWHPCPPPAIWRRCHSRNTGIVPTTGGVNLLPVARTFNLDCQGYTPLNRTNVHSTSPSYPMCFQGRSTNNLKGRKAVSLVKVSSKKWSATLSFALRDCCKTPRTRHSSQHYRSLLSVSEDNVGETKRRNRCFATVPLTTPLPCCEPTLIL